MPLDEGAPAPEVAAQNQDGEVVRPDVEGPTVLYFYPRDETSGCTTEGRQFQAELDAYHDAGVTVYGVSTDDVDSHAAFVEAEGFEFDLLADPEGELLDAFGIERGYDDGAARTTVVLLDGEIWRVYEDVDPDGHAREVLSDLLDAAVVTLPES